MSGEREKILQMVADGTITTEEANRLIECLDIIIEQNENEAAAEETAAKEEPVKSEETHVPEGDFNDSQHYGNSYNGNTITAFDISWINGPITVRKYSGQQINITEYSKYELQEEDRMLILEEGGTLKIKWDRGGYGFNLASLKRLISKPFLSKELLIEIPESMAQSLDSFKCSALSSKMNIGDLNVGLFNISTTSGGSEIYNISTNIFKVSSVSGKMYLGGISGEKVNIESTSGGMEINGMQANTLRIDSVSGGITFKGIADEFKCDSVSGKIDLDFDACPNKVNCDAVSGKTTMYLPENDGFTAKYTSVSGKFNTDFEAAIEKKDDKCIAVYKNGAAKIKLGSVSGQLNIRRK